MTVFLGLLESLLFLVLIIGLVALLGKTAGYFSRYKD